MNKYIKASIALVFSLAYLYLIGSFLFANFDISKWEVVGRFPFVILSFGCLLLFQYVLESQK